MRDALLFERAASSFRFLDGDTAPGGGRVPEHCPISILQAHGGGAIPRLALWTKRFVRLLSALAVELPRRGRGDRGRLVSRPCTLISPGLLKSFSPTRKAVVDITYKIRRDKQEYHLSITLSPKFS